MKKAVLNALLITVVGAVLTAGDGRATSVETLRQVLAGQDKIFDQQLEMIRQLRAQNKMLRAMLMTQLETEGASPAPSPTRSVPGSSRTPASDPVLPLVPAENMAQSLEERQFQPLKTQPNGGSPASSRSGTAGPGDPDPLPKETEDLDETEESSEDWRFSFTPRSALRWISTTQYSADPLSQGTASEPMFWVNGFNFSAYPPQLPGWSLEFSALTGESEGDFRGTASVGGAAVATAGTYDGDYNELELLVRKWLPDWGVLGIAGVNYLNTSMNQTIDPGFAAVFDGTRKRKITNDTGLAKIGLAGYFDLGESGYHRLFSNIMLGLGGTWRTIGSADSDFAMLYAHDLNLGYQWIINQDFSLSTRYRGQFAFPFGRSEPYDDEWQVIHGPEVHFTWNF